jgi:hypothetical protein
VPERNFGNQFCSFDAGLPVKFRLARVAVPTVPDAAWLKARAK